MAYSNVRSETHYTREYIIETLMNDPDIIKVWDDGSDLVVVTLSSGQRVMFYLVELYMSLHEIQKTLADNAEKGMHTLFMFWADMLLPNDGEYFMPQDWMMALLALYDEKIYGYDVSANDVYIFPAHFDVQPGYNERYIRWGRLVNLHHLRPEFADLESVHLKGHFRTASFAPPTSHQAQSEASEQQQSAPRYASRSAMHRFYELLAIPMDATPEDIKRAYRDLARQYHPDMNPDAEATSKMQAINQAYDHILAQFNE